MQVPVPAHVPANSQTACHGRLKAGSVTREPASPRVSEGTGGARASGTGVAGAHSGTAHFPKSPICEFSRAPKTPEPAIRDPLKTGAILVVFPLNHPALRGGRRSSIQTALYWPVFLFVKCSIRPTGVTLWFHEKHRPENPRNRPVGCSSQCNPGSF